MVTLQIRQRTSDPLALTSDPTMPSGSAQSVATDGAVKLAIILAVIFGVLFISLALWVMYWMYMKKMEEERQLSRKAARVRRPAWPGARQLPVRGQIRGEKYGRDQNSSPYRERKTNNQKPAQKPPVILPPVLRKPPVSRTTSSLVETESSSSTDPDETSHESSTYLSSYSKVSASVRAYPGPREVDPRPFCRQDDDELEAERSSPGPQIPERREDESEARWETDRGIIERSESGRSIFSVPNS